jgi:hypothetical protein
VSLEQRTADILIEGGGEEIVEYLYTLLGLFSLLRVPDSVSEKTLEPL